jgi:hypothetical protein
MEPILFTLALGSSNIIIVLLQFFST